MSNLAWLNRRNTLYATKKPIPRLQSSEYVLVWNLQCGESLTILEEKKDMIKIQMRDISPVRNDLDNPIELLNYFNTWKNYLCKWQTEQVIAAEHRQNQVGFENFM